MNDEALIAAVTSAAREEGVDGVLRFHPSWFDLPDAGRVAAHDATGVQRALEAALDPQGRSGTVHAVLARIRASTR
jgi:hypothetical protein